jgi:hypothetical protein
MGRAASTSRLFPIPSRIETVRRRLQNIADHLFFTMSVFSEVATVGKKALLENTDKAFAEGAFGLPWMVCTNSKGQKEGFWGVDHLGQVIHFLGLEKPEGRGWKAVL